MPLITIVDTNERFSAEDGETILGAAQRSSTPFSFSCQAGNCGSCKCELIEGDIFEQEYSEFALTAAERATNLILACRTQVWGDTTIRRLSDEEIVMHPSRILRCRVSDIVQSTHDIRTVRLTNEDSGPLMFSAGQYASLEFAPGLVKQYSMANMPDETVLEFQVRRAANGRTSVYVAETLKGGDIVTVHGPLGSSYLRDRHAGPVIMIAGGTGLAPLQSILRTMLTRGHAGPLMLYFGVRAERDVYNEALLAALAEQHPNFSYQVVLSDDGGAETTTLRRRSGFVHHAVDADLVTVDGYKAYLAGPPVMVEAATEMLKAKGLSVRDIHADAYYDQP